MAFDFEPEWFKAPKLKNEKEDCDDIKYQIFGIFWQILSKEVVAYAYLNLTVLKICLRKFVRWQNITMPQSALKKWFSNG